MRFVHQVKPASELASEAEIVAEIFSPFATLSKLSRCNHFLRIQIQVKIYSSSKAPADISEPHIAELCRSHVATAGPTALHTSYASPGADQASSIPNECSPAQSLHSNLSIYTPRPRSALEDSQGALLMSHYIESLSGWVSLLNHLGLSTLNLTTEILLARS